MVEEAVPPVPVVPEVPSFCLSLKVDHPSGLVSMDQDPLLKTFRKYRDYIRNLNERSFIVLHNEFTSEIQSIHKEMKVLVRECTGSVETMLETRLEESELVVNKRLEILEADNKRLSEMARRALETAENAVLSGPGETPEQPRRHVPSAAERRRSSALQVVDESEHNSERHSDDEVDDSAQAVDEEHHDRYQPAKEERRKSEAPVGDGLTRADLLPFAKITDLTPFRADIEVLQGDMLTTSEEAKRLEGKVDSHFLALTEQDMACRELIKEQSVRIDQLFKQLVEVREHADAQAKKLNKLEDELKTKAKASALAELKQEVAKVKDMASLALPVPGLEVRLGQTEHGIHSVKGVAEQTKEGVAALRQLVAELGQQIEHCAGELADVSSRADSAQSRAAGLAAQRSAVTEQVRRLEGRLEECIALVEPLSEGLAAKAEQAEFASLRDSVRALVQDMKDQEQSVLFGARCLSCNRVFDDVQQHAGVVSLHGEKQKEKLFAEVQRALHTPARDPNKTIRMLAVKVGRPAGLSDTRGHGFFEGRDAASLACGLEDVHLVPVRGGVESSGEPRLPSMPGSARAVGTEAMQSPRRRVRKLAGTGDVAPSKDGVDFKHQLSHLVGRS
mmetsp:Transcript_72721/g.157825  ORF Transcript_72721/g.157825 Transcript_72721/m.157825 type:complete len:619 (+) Transcript_72721:62-1918(+)